jgi:hypothetical protein
LSKIIDGVRKLNVSTYDLHDTANVLVSANSNIRESLHYIRKRILLLKIRANYSQKVEFEFAFAHLEFGSN